MSAKPKTDPVTDRRTCYIFICCGCNLLDVSARSDTLTCSNACRVRAHRNGSVKLLRKVAATYDVPPASIKQAEAVWRLRPDLAEKIHAGTLTIEQAQPDVHRAFARTAMADAVRRSS